MNWILASLCLAFAFVFSGTEAGLLSVNRVRLTHLGRQKDPAAIRVQRLLDKPVRLFVTVLFVTSLMNVITIVLVASQLVQAFGAWGYLATLCLVLPIFVILIEFLAKSIFRRFPYTAIASIAVVLEVASTLLTPVMWLGSLFARDVLRLKRPHEIFVAREDLKYLTTQIERMGMLSSMERQMIHNVVDFRSVRVENVMIPINQVSCVLLDTPVEDIVKRSRETKFDRFPVRDADGNILGMVNMIDMVVDRRADATAKQYLRRMLSLRLDDPAPIAMRRLRAAPQSLATVIDQQGNTVGIVSAEDLLNPLIKGSAAPTKNTKN